ncbi:MAG: NAD(P)-binding domain-containing protein [Pseudomonadota bacterium]
MTTGIGIAGCGRMGLPMARVLLKVGVEVHGFDGRPVAEFGSFSGRMVAAPRDFAMRCGTVFTVVRDQRQTDDLLFDEQALLAGDNAIETLVVCSTLSPRYLASLRDRVPRAITLIDAPMSGAAVAAEEARLSFMLGGDPEALDAIQPLLDTMGAHFHRMGGFGAGMTAKVLNNFVAAASVASVRQALDWSDRLGVDRDKLLALMHDSSGQTWFGSNFDSIEFARDGFDPDNTIGILKKDVESALDAVGANPSDGLQAAILDYLETLEPDRSP